MSRKDYVALAEALKQAKDKHREILGAGSVLKDAAERIADVLQSDNPRFDRGRFLTACGFGTTPDVCEVAHKFGHRAGVAAGSWIIDGNTDEETATWYLFGIESGDPEVLDSLPSCPLSGEWAGSLLPADVLAEHGIRENDPVSDDVLSAFEDGYSAGVVEEVERAARAIL